MIRGAASAFVLVAALLAAACGTPSADLFVVERGGDIPGAQLDLVVGDGNTVTCNGTERPFANDKLLRARELARDLEPLLDRKLTLPTPSGAQLTFRVFNDKGEARFADASAARDPALSRLLAFTRAVAQESCGLPR
ncbi:MAG TPA: hypothetical protein VN238_22235 [Solirubrobacteraceae bacterium]|nr:hypothetical protein [Solirubrobacteraceae bacterium]